MMMMMMISTSSGGFKGKLDDYFGPGCVSELPDLLHGGGKHLGRRTPFAIPGHLPLPTGVLLDPAHMGPRGASPAGKTSLKAAMASFNKAAACAFTESSATLS
jgi:hypothetical protein